MAEESCPEILQVGMFKTLVEIFSVSPAVKVRTGTVGIKFLAAATNDHMCGCATIVSMMTLAKPLSFR